MIKAEKPAIKCCVWDVGKTIYDFSLLPFEQWLVEQVPDKRKFIAEGGLKSFDFKPYMRGIIDSAEMGRQLCRHFDIEHTPAVLPAINRELHRGIGRYYDETRKMMAYMRDKGIENAVFSNAMPILNDTVDYPDLLKKENIFVSYKTGLLKPEAAVYEHVRAHFGCRFGEMIMVDDKEENIRAAQALGMHGVVFRPETVEENLTAVVEGGKTLFFDKRKIDFFPRQF